MGIISIRVDRIQLNVPMITIDRPGSNPYFSTLPMKARLMPGLMFESYADLAGNSPIEYAKTYTRISATKKYGTCERAIDRLVAIAEPSLPRRQPAMAPMMTPRIHAITAEMPSRPIVQGNDRRITVWAGVG